MDHISTRNEVGSQILHNKHQLHHKDLAINVKHKAQHNTSTVVSAQNIGHTDNDSFSQIDFVGYDDDSDVVLLQLKNGSEGKGNQSGPTVCLQNKLVNMRFDTVKNVTTSAHQPGIQRMPDVEAEQLAKKSIIVGNQKKDLNLHSSQTDTIGKNETTSPLIEISENRFCMPTSTITTQKTGTKTHSQQSYKDKSVKDKGGRGQDCGQKSPLVSESGGSLDSTYPVYLNDGFSEKSSVVVSCTGALQQHSVVTSKVQSIESRPIYPNVPYSPYASPYGSPNTNRRRAPLRESRRISIEQSGSFLQLNQYKLMDQIGQGSYGLVKLAYSEEDSTHYAMKILSKRRLLRQAGLIKRGPKKITSPLDRVYREIAVLKKLDHPNVVKLVEVLDDPIEDSLYMVFELVKQGEVLSIPTDKPLSEERVWSVFRETLLGLEYLHYQRIIHADLKPGNLLLTEDGHVKIADLGVCNEFFGEDATISIGLTAGTPAFRAPETLNLGQNMYCGKAADIWALGITLYSLVFGNVPFVASSIPVLYEKIKNELLEFPNTPHISEELRDCLQRMLTKDPVKRISLPQLKEHTWTTSGGLHTLSSEAENCRLVQVSDDDINSVVKSIPKLDTLILIKTMLKKHSFGNPFAKSMSGRAPQLGGSRLERFIRAGRSNSAPGAYNIAMDRQLSGDSILPSLSEIGGSSHNEES